MSVAWTEDLTTGHPLIDAQHKELLRRFDAFLEAGRRGASGPLLPRLLVYLQDYVDHHFADEEKLMREAGYPALPTHQRAHDELRGQLARMEGSRAGDPDRLLAIMRANRLIGDWLIHHIRTHDKRLAAWLRDAGR